MPTENTPTDNTPAPSITTTPFVPEFMKPGYVYNPQTVIPNPPPATPTSAPAVTPTSDPHSPGTAPTLPAADQKKPGEVYRGRDTSMHAAQFDNDYFRVCTPEELEKLRAEAGTKTRKQVYPFATLEIGHEWIIPHGSALTSVRNSMNSYGKRHGREYLIRKLPNGRPAVVRLR